MKGRKIMRKHRKLSTALALVFGLTSMISTMSVTTASAAENSDKLKIMAVGDSITHGYINGDNGYRKYLCYHLQQNGIDYDMVGPNNGWSDTATYNWNGTTITYDPAHAGNSGYSIMNYSGRSGTYEFLFGNGNMIQTYDPDMVLLQIGTNDLLDANLGSDGSRASGISGG